jgi:hypothetical protein
MQLKYVTTVVAWAAKRQRMGEEEKEVVESQPPCLFGAVVTRLNVTRHHVAHDACVKVELRTLALRTQQALASTLPH